MLSKEQIMEIEVKQRHSETNRSFDQVDLGDVYRIYHPKTKEYTFFSAPHGTFTNIDHILQHKTNLILFKKIEIITYILSYHH